MGPGTVTTLPSCRAKLARLPKISKLPSRSYAETNEALSSRRAVLATARALHARERDTQSASHTATLRSPPVAALGDQTVDGVRNICRGKFAIHRATRIGVIGGSCTRYLVQSMKERGFFIGDEERPPPGCSAPSARRFGYLTHSVRTGDLATPRLVLQLVREARGEFTPTDAIWERNGRYFDAIRPLVEPDGLGRPETVTDHRRWHLSRVNRLLETSAVLLFAITATDAWEHVPSGTVYPVAPGEIAGVLDPVKHRLRSFTYREVYDDLVGLFALCKSANPSVRFLLAVSATTSLRMAGAARVVSEDGNATLQAVADQLYGERDDVDHLPELAAGPEPDLELGAPLGGMHSEQATIAEGRVVLDDDEELETMLAGDEECEEILNETFRT